MDLKTSFNVSSEQTKYGIWGGTLDQLLGNPG